MLLIFSWGLFGNNYSPRRRFLSQTSTSVFPYTGANIQSHCRLGPLDFILCRFSVGLSANRPHFLSFSIFFVLAQLPLALLKVCLFGVASIFSVFLIISENKKVVELIFVLFPWIFFPNSVLRALDCIFVLTQSIPSKNNFCFSKRIKDWMLMQLVCFAFPSVAIKLDTFFILASCYGVVQTS